MATLEEVTAEVQTLKSNLESIDTTLNAVAEKISQLVAGQVDQAQIDALSQLVNSAKSVSESVKSEAETLAQPEATEPTA